MFKAVPWGDILYACDKPWWDHYINQLRGSFGGDLWTLDKAAAVAYGLNHVPYKDRPGLGRNGIIHSGGNGGYQTLNLAYLFGAKKIVLLGFDMQETDGRSHSHGDHPGSLNRQSNYKNWVRNYQALARDLRDAGVEVINATRQTALLCFKKATLEEALCP